MDRKQKELIYLNAYVRFGDLVGIVREIDDILQEVALIVRLPNGHSVTWFSRDVEPISPTEYFAASLKWHWHDKNQ